MPDHTVVLVGAAFVLASLAQWSRRRAAARDAAERWLERHGYRVRSLGETWRAGASFPLRLRRDADATFAFRATVDDRKLGGTGVVGLRVAVDWLARADDDVDVRWERMPDPRALGPPAPTAAWADAQLAVLRRVADGERTFRPGGTEPAGAPLDAVVEHLLALQRRGLVTCATPHADLRGHGACAAVTDAALTAEGRRALARADARSG
jgi:hypothetical protein